LRKRQHDVQVVNHQVQHHVHIERARREHREPVRLKKHGPPQFGLDSQHRGVESLQMAGLQNPSALALASAKQSSASASVAASGFSTSKSRSRIQQRRGNRVMMDVGTATVAASKRRSAASSSATEGENGNRVLSPPCRRRGPHRAQRRLTSATPKPARLQFVVDAEVVAAKSSGSGNGDAQDGLACYCCAAPLPSTAFRQRP
jgi:hypothetical protein